MQKKTPAKARNIFASLRGPSNVPRTIDSKTSVFNSLQLTADSWRSTDINFASLESAIASNLKLK
jgi:hypothetical protein